VSCGAGRYGSESSFVDVENHSMALASPRVSEASVGDYLALLKPRVMSLWCHRAGRPADRPRPRSPVLAVTSILCIAGRRRSLRRAEHGYDADIDALMSRTAKRPVPTGR